VCAQECIAYKVHEKLIRPNVPITHVYFPQSGQISVIAGGHDSEPIEVGMIGRESMTEMVAAPGRGPHAAHLSGAGSRRGMEDHG
jgi:CRP-like cAMP-binding protein